MAGYRLYRFIKEIDAYAQPIQLAYKGQKSHPTIVGGVLTICHTCLFMSFFAYVGLILVEQQWNINTYTESNVFLAPDSNDVTSIMMPTYILKPWQYAPAFKIFSSVFQEEDIYKTVTPYYVAQDDQNNMTTYLMAVSCNSVYTQEQYDIMFGTEQNMMCPNITDETQYLKLGTAFKQGSKFYLNFSFCEAVTNLNNQTDCYNYAKASPHLDSLTVATYFTSMIPSGNDVLDSATTQPHYNQVYQFLKLTDKFSSLYQMTIQPVNASFAYNWFFMNFQQNQTTLYETQPMGPANVQNIENDYPILSFVFELPNIVTINEWQRICFMTMIGELGGITAILVFMIGPFLQAFNNFTIDNSMVRKLFTLPKSKDRSQIKTVNSSISINEQSNDNLMKSDQHDRKISIISRQVFNYRIGLALCDYIRTNCCCCFCNLCLCKKSKMNKKFHKAKERLYNEIDLVELVKMMRFSRFLSSIHLEKHHWHLISKFDKYCVKDDQSSDSASSHESDQSDEQQHQHFDDNDDHYPGQADDALLTHDALLWYGKPSHQAKLVSKLMKERKFTRREREKLQNWLSQVKQLWQLSPICNEFQSTAGDYEKLDKQAIKLLIGKHNLTDDEIQSAIQEIQDEFDSAEHQVHEFAETTQGKWLIETLSGRKLTLTKNEERASVLDIQDQ